MVSDSVSPRVGMGRQSSQVTRTNADVTSNGLEGLAWQGLRSMSPVHAQSLSPPLRPRFKPIGRGGRRAIGNHLSRRDGLKAVSAQRSNPFPQTAQANRSRYQGIWLHKSGPD